MKHTLARFALVIFFAITSLTVIGKTEEESCVATVDTAVSALEMPAIISETDIDYEDIPSGHYRSHHPRWQSFALPAGLTVASSLFATSGWMGEQRNNLQRWLDTTHKQKKIDNYTQYAPLITMYGLKACGVRSEHNILGQTTILLMSGITMATVVNCMKYTVQEPRPDKTTDNSFPSGHTATAFMCAEMLFQEYRDVSPWIGYCGYFMAGLTGCLRIYNNRHWMNDVVAGACIGIMSTKFAYWLYPKIFGASKCGDTGRATIGPVVENGGCSLCVAWQF